MTWSRPWPQLGRLAERESLQPDLGRAVRATVAFMVPLLLAFAGWLPFEVTFMAISAQNIAMVDVRGDYRLRLGLLLAMTFVFAGAAGLGTLVSNHLLLAVLATGLVAACGGLWRHLSTDYGASLAISSTLVFAIALASPTGAAAAGDHSLAALLGGLWGVALQVANWPFRPQHPLRRAVADSWLAVGDLFEAMKPGAASDAGARAQRVGECEAALRTTLDKTFATLSPGGTRPSLLRRQLEELNLAAARLATRVVALNTALETLIEEGDFAALAPSFEPVLASLVNTTRTVALAVVSRQPAHLATAEVRLRRLTNLLRVLQTRVPALTHDTATGHQLLGILSQIDGHLPPIRAALRATIDRADERAAFSLELFDIDTWTLRPLASALNLSRHIDASLLRFTGRIAVLTMTGTFIYKTWSLPHGYWLPLTMVVVLQPDYGSTRQRAAQRVLGTLAGSILASLLLWLHLPFAALATATAATIFAFGYFVRRNYALAVFFITLFVVLLTEATGPVTLAFTAERLANTLGGGALALLAAMFFWPVWERDRLPPILARALRANRAYLQIVSDRLATGGGYDPAAVRAKRQAEAANGAVFSSLQRMIGDPRNRQEGLEQAGALTNGNQRLTRALNVIVLHLTPSLPLQRPAVAACTALVGDALETLARAVESETPAPGGLAPLLAALENVALPVPPAAGNDAAAQRDHWVFTQLTRAATELSAMVMAVDSAAAPAPAAQ
jgi:uncharacterized membrane protein YccC